MAQGQGSLEEIGSGDEMTCRICDCGCDALLTMATFELDVPGFSSAEWELEEESDEKVIEEPNAQAQYQVHENMPSAVLSLAVIPTPDFQIAVQNDPWSIDDPWLGRARGVQGAFCGLSRFSATIATAPAQSTNG